jgi:fatty acid desaturase
MEDESMTAEATTPSSASEKLRRERAIKRARDKRNFKAVLVAYFVVNALLVTAWAIWSNHEEFWPGWTLGIWGLIMASWGWDLYGRPRPVSEEAIQREMRREQERRT